VKIGVLSIVLFRSRRNIFARSFEKSQGFEWSISNFIYS